MNRRIMAVTAMTMAAALVIGVAVGAADTHRFEAGNLVIEDHGGIAPKALPRHGAAPITAFIHAKIGTKDGSHPPAAQTLTIDFDRTIQIDTRGLPACGKGQLESRSTKAVERACGDAIVGRGTAAVDVAFDEQAPFAAQGPLLAFNGGTRGGVTVLFIHAYLDVPVPTAVVVETQMRPTHQGHFGIHTVTTIPPIAGGAGSPTEFRLHLGRKFTYKGAAHSYLAASCPTGHYFVKGHADFSDGTEVHVSHVLPCTPTG